MTILTLTVMSMALVRVRALVRTSSHVSCEPIPRFIVEGLAVVVDDDDCTAINVILILSWKRVGKHVRT